jgi:hypothetical protein
MSKKVNFVFDWIGPARPIPNNTVPNIIDLAFATGRADIKRNPKELQAELQNSDCYDFLKKMKLVRTCTASDLPAETFVYEYNHYWWHSVEEFFGVGKLGGMLGWGQMPNPVFDRIRAKTAYLLVTIPMESPLRDTDLHQIEDYFRASGLPMSQVIYLTCSPNCQEVYDDFCIRLNKPNEGIKFEYLPFYFFIYKRFAGNKSLDYIIDEKKKTFLMFNRRWGSQTQRVLMLAYLYKNNLLDEFNISFSKTEIDNGGTYTDHARKFFGRLTTENIITDEDLEEIESRLPLILDSNDFTQNLMFDELDTTKHFYDESLVNLISETNFFTNIVHLTEKSYKPIMYKQPFIMLGAKGSLTALRKQGFKTFEEYWDESYDDEADDTKRFFKVLDLIKEISSWSAERKLEFSALVKNTVDFNYTQIQQGHSQLVTNFVNKYGT